MKDIRCNVEISPFSTDRFDSQLNGWTIGTSRSTNLNSRQFGFNILQNASARPAQCKQKGPRCECDKNNFFFIYAWIRTLSSSYIDEYSAYIHEYNFREYTKSAHSSFEAPLRVSRQSREQNYTLRVQNEVTPCIGCSDL